MGIRRRVRIALIISFVGAVPGTASAFRIIGSGVSSCGSWTESRRYGGYDRSGDEQWLVGFLSGIGYAGDPSDDPLGGLDAQAVWGWIDNYCQQNPTLSIEDAAKAFYHFHPHPSR